MTNKSWNASDSIDNICGIIKILNSLLHRTCPINLIYPFFTALFGRIDGLYGSNDSDENDGNGRKRGSADTEDAGYPASPLPGQSSRIDTMFDDFDSDFMPPGKLE